MMDLLTSRTGHRATGGAGLPCRVLLAEDNEGDATLLREALEEAGGAAGLTAVVTLADALEQARTNQFDVLLIDLALPDSQGLDTLREAQRAAPDLPVVVLTGLDDESVARQALHEGAQDYLIKGEWIRQGGSRALMRSLQYAVNRHRTVAALREAARVRMMFMASASHELRTPITIIRDYAWLLSDGTVGPLAEGQVECVEAILRNCSRLGALVSDLLDTTKMESGNLLLKIEQTQPQVLLQQCHDDFDQICRAKKQTLILDIEGELRPVLCDRQRLTQVIVNLLANANRFTPEGGRITLRGRMQADDLRIDVEDTGVGIAPEDQSDIFEAFVQVDRRAGPGPQGTGLGLYIARRIASMHGGAITVSSRKGEGSIFTITIPSVSLGADLAGLRACLMACSGPGTAADLTMRSHSVIWLRASPIGGPSVDDRGVRLRQVEATATSLFRRHDSAFYSEADRVLACLIEGGCDEARGFLSRLHTALNGDCQGLRYAVVPVNPGSPHESAVPPPEVTMRPLALRAA